MINSITDRDSLLRVFSTTPPISECNFFLTIDPHEAKEISSELVVTGFNIPQVGIAYEQDSNALGYVQPRLSLSNLTVSFLCNDSGNLGSCIHELYELQFNKSGTLKFISASKRPTVTLNLFTGGETIQLISFSGCRFSYPIPTTNLDSVNPSVFNTQIAYEHYKILT